MTDTYTKLKKELSVLYPDITEKDRNNIALNLVNFFTLATQILEESKELDNELISDEK